MSTHCQKKKPPPTNQTPTLSIEDVGSHPSGKPQCSNLGRLGMQKSKQWEFGPPCSYDVTLDIFPWKVSSFLTMLVSSCHCDPPRVRTVHPLFVRETTGKTPRVTVGRVCQINFAVSVMFCWFSTPAFGHVFSISTKTIHIQSGCKVHVVSRNAYTKMFNQQWFPIWIPIRLNSYQATPMTCQPTFFLPAFWFFSNKKTPNFHHW